jgi:hypothetical protein
MQHALSYVREVAQAAGTESLTIDVGLSSHNMHGFPLFHLADPDADGSSRELTVHTSARLFQELAHVAATGDPLVPRSSHAKRFLCGTVGWRLKPRSTHGGQEQVDGVQVRVPLAPQSSSSSSVS